jgi:DNA-binding CsgD family transcriptional regulator
VPGPGPATGRRLTRRERDVLQQAAHGKSNRQIGESLEIAEQTVKNHLSSAMRKLSLHDRTHAVVVALGQGLIRLPRLKAFPIRGADLVEGHALESVHRPLERPRPPRPVTRVNAQTGRREAKAQATRRTED